MRCVWLLVCCLGLAAAQDTPTGTRTVPQYTDDGRLRLPEDYREWVFLSSGLGMTYGPLAAGRNFPKMFDNVFVTREAYRAFRDAGRWPDKTMFVLEVRHGASHGSINKDGHFQTDLSGLEMLVRDEARFPDKWGFFDFPTRGGEPAATGRPLGKQAGCLACHSANGAVDGTFVQFYPTLLAVAEKKGTLRADYKPFTPSPARLYHILEKQGWPAAEKALESARAEDPGAAVLNEAALNGLGYQVLGSNPRLAVPLFRWIAGAHPQSANAQDSLAEALDAAGDKAGVLEAARKALELLPGDSTLTDRQRTAIEEANRKRVGEPKL